MSERSHEQVPEWSLRPGERIRRVDLHRAFGGSGQGGISPSARSPNVFVFTDPDVGEDHGYFDRWHPDGALHYTGEGQRGDQQMQGGNRSLRDHAEARRAVRVFQGSGGVVTYVGRCELGAELPWYQADAPETGGGPIRRVIVFRLVPVDFDPPAPTAPLEAPGVNTVPIEARYAEQWLVNSSSESTVARATEWQLVQTYAGYLRLKGLTVVRHRYRPDDSTQSLVSDLYIEERNQLVEAKGSVSRDAVRMGLGQLLDYRRFEPPLTKLGMLLPEPPRSDLRALVQSVNVTVIWPVGRERFEDSSDGRFS